MFGRTIFCCYQLENIRKGFNMGNFCSFFDPHNIILNYFRLALIEQYVAETYFLLRNLICILEVLCNLSLLSNSYLKFRTTINLPVASHKIHSLVSNQCRLNANESPKELLEKWKKKKKLFLCILLHQKLPKLLRAPSTMWRVLASWNSVIIVYERSWHICQLFHYFCLRDFSAELITM